MYELKFSDEFDEWLRKLADGLVRARITARLTKAAEGHFGDCVSVGEGIFEMRIHLGPGYRLYYKRIGRQIVFFLCGGNKSSQPRDILRAKKMAAELKGGEDGLY